jgi:hypothetical protein
MVNLVFSRSQCFSEYYRYRFTDHTFSSGATGETVSWRTDKTQDICSIRNRKRHKKDRERPL